MYQSYSTQPQPISYHKSTNFSLSKFIPPTSNRVNRERAELVFFVKLRDQKHNTFERFWDLKKLAMAFFGLVALQFQIGIYYCSYKNMMRFLGFVSILLMIIVESDGRTCLRSGGVWDSADSLELDGEVGFHLQWRNVAGRMEIVLSAGIQGYMAFGIGEQTSGSMLGADIVTVNLDGNGQPQVRDRWAPYAAFPFAPYDSMYQKNETHIPGVWTGDYLFPYTDCENGGTDDWVLESFNRDVVGNEPCTQAVLSRAVFTGDVNDRDFQPGPMKFIWAHGNETNAISYHGGNRGTARAEFISDGLPGDPFANEPCNIGDGCEVVTFTMGNYTVPAKETTYAVREFLLLGPNPAVNTSKHIIYFEPYIRQETKEYVHHLVIMGCYGNRTNEWAKFNETSRDEHNEDPKACGEVLYAWAVGGNPLKTPPNVGFPVGNENGDQILYVSIETHYTNPFKHEGVVDDSGITFHITSEPREYEAGTMMLGGVGESEIPSGIDAVHLQSTCPTGCTQLFPQPIHVFGSFMHMHSFGKQIWTSQYDSLGNFKATTNRIDFWNFETQQTTPVNYTIQPGDRMQTHCVFNTSKWDFPITFGESSFEEMCLDILSYYPVVKPRLNMCGVRAFYPDPRYTDSICDFDENFTMLSNTQIQDDANTPGASPTVTFAVSAPAQECIQNGNTGGSVRPSSNPDFTFEMDINNDSGLIFWKIMEEEGGFLRVRIEVAGSIWLGFGIGETMVGSSALLGTASNNVGEYRITAKRSSGVSLEVSSGNILGSSFTQAGGQTILEFNATSILNSKLNIGVTGRRMLAAGDGELTENDVLLAFGDSNVFPEQHARTMAFRVNWKTGTLVGGPKNWTKVILVHAGLMVVAFTLFYSFGAVEAIRKVRERVANENSVTLVNPSVDEVGLKNDPSSSMEQTLFIRHIEFVGLGICCHLAGVVYMIASKGSGTHFSTLHEIIGIVVTGLAIVQVFLGLFRPHKDNRPAWWIFAHRRILPSLVIFGGIANAVYALFLYELTSAMGPAHYVLLLGPVVIFLMLCGFTQFLRQKN